MTHRMDEKKVRRSERCRLAGTQRTHTRGLEWGSDLAETTYRITGNVGVV